MAGHPDPKGSLSADILASAIYCFSMPGGSKSDGVHECSPYKSGSLSFLQCTSLSHCWVNYHIPTPLSTAYKASLTTHSSIG